MTENSKHVAVNEALAPAIAAGAAARDSKKEESDSPFAVAVTDVYEGPLDLLLDLIRKQDIDIYDIPIAKITAQYLAYVEKIRELDVNIAAEFIYMAAVLIHIKSKMLLPRDPDATGEEQEDPRNELVNRLLEHEKFKSAAQMLLQKQQIEDAVLSNPSLKEFMEAEGTEPEIAADVIDLVKTFQQILERVRTRPVLNVDEETVTVGQTPEGIRLSPDGKLAAVTVMNGSNKPRESPFFNEAGKLILYRVDGTRLVPLAAAFVGRWSQGVEFSADSRMILVGNMVERNVQVLRWDGTSLTDRGERIPVNGGSAALRIADRP